MSRRLMVVLGVLALAAPVVWWLARAEGDVVADAARPPAAEQAAAGPGAASPAATPPVRGEVDAAVDVDPRDLAIFYEKLETAAASRLGELPIGEIVARLGATFVGATYTPHTLERPGEERLVVNLRELDCVTFVENALVLSRMIRDGDSDFGRYLNELTRIRYRGGRIDGYPSRLHYFTDWIFDNEGKRLVRDITRELGGEPVSEPVNFMSRNPDAYRQLADPAKLDAIRGVEARLTAKPRYFIPQERIAEIAPRIRNGDIIAATSTVHGLDVAHTGIAIWVDGRLHLLHAPLVGRFVEISEKPLAERIFGIAGQDGVIVARPL